MSNCSINNGAETWPTDATRALEHWKNVIVELLLIAVTRRGVDARISTFWTLVGGRHQDQRGVAVGRPSVLGGHAALP